jgi:ATP-dependent Clp protease adapter protein ClpS
MKASQFRALIKEEVKKALKESAMSDIDLMAQDASTFNQFAVEFFKEYPNIQKDEKMGFIKWLKTVYKNAKENK